jgi:hypothetical protein
LQQGDRATSDGTGDNIAVNYIPRPCCNYTSDGTGDNIAVNYIPRPCCSAQTRRLVCARSNDVFYRRARLA